MKISWTIRSGVALAIGMMALLGAQPASAQLYMDLTGGSSATDNRNFVLGYSFTVSSPTPVDSLGVFDVGGDGLQLNYPVAIWNQSSPAVPLVSSIVPSGVAGAPVGSTAGNGLWRMVTVPLTNLTPGTTYVIAMYRQGSVEGVDFGTPAPASGINYGNKLELETNTLVMPTSNTGTNGHFGPTFGLFGGGTSAPEPTSLVLLTLGTVGFLARRRK